MDKVFGMLGLLLAGLKVVGRWFTDSMNSFWLLKEFCMCLTSFVRTGLTELGFATHPRQAYGIREAQKEAEGATEAVLFEWKLLAFTRFEFAQKL